MNEINKKMVNISCLIEKIEYTELIEQISCISNIFTLAILEDISPKEISLESINTLNEFLISCKSTNHWGLTMGLNAFVYKFTLNDKSKMKLIQNASNIYEWMNPKKPEDLCFFYNENPILLTLAHEKMAYIEKTKFNHLKKSNNL